MSAPEGPRPRARAALLALLAFAVTAPLVGWGAPRANAPDRTLTWATDDPLPLGPLAELHNTFVVSKPDRNYAYPWWHYLVAGAAQAPYLAWLKLTGGLDEPGPVFPFGLADPERALVALTALGRLASALMAAGTAACAYLFARELWGERAGVLAGLLSALNPWMVYYGRTGNLDVPAIFWSALGLVCFARILRRGLCARRAAWLGLWAGVAMATKDQALAVFLPLALCLCWPGFAPRAPAGERAGRARLAGLGAALLAYALCAGMAVDPARHVVHVRKLLFEQRDLTASRLYWPHLEPSLASAAELAGGTLRALAAVLTPAGLALAAAGLGLALAGRLGARRDASLALPVLATFALLVLATGLVVRRYQLPLALPLDGFAAAALAALVARRRGLGLAAAGLVLAWRAAGTLDLTLAQLADPRIAAARWIEERARPGDRVEYFGHPQKLPHLPADVASRRALGRGAEWEGQADHGPAVLAELASGAGPELVLVVPDWTSRPGMVRSADCPPEVFAALEDGSAGYARAALFDAPRFLPPPFARPALDSPCVAPPVRVYARADVSGRFGGAR